MIHRYNTHVEVIKNHKHLRKDCQATDWSNVVELRTHTAIFYVCDHDGDIINLDYGHSADNYLIPWVQSECSACGYKFNQTAEDTEIPHSLWLESIQEEKK